jgi:hypothetical protein
LAFLGAVFEVDASFYTFPYNIYQEQLKTKETLEWDKDDPPALDFVTACANIRMFIFNIPQKSR